jgi:hypothetical protein
MGKWLLNEKNPERLREAAYTKEPDADLRVFPDGKLPEGALNEQELIQSLVAMHSKQLEERKPINSRSLKNWKKEMLPAWEHALQLQHIAWSSEVGGAGGITVTREPDGKKIRFANPGLKITKDSSLIAVVVGSGTNSRLDSVLEKNGLSTVRLKPSKAEVDVLQNYFHAYNRTPVQDTVASVKILIAHLRERFGRKKILLIGEGDGGFAALAAAPLADAVIADADGLRETNDEGLLDANRFFPGIRRVGSLQGMAALAAPNPLYVHNIKAWTHDWLGELYAKESSKFQTQAARATDDEIAEWISSVVGR